MEFNDGAPQYELMAHHSEEEGAVKRKKLWRVLRSRRFEGFKFRRQHVVGPYIADFCCLSKRLIIELDGGQHASQVDSDQIRTKFLKQKGYRVIRFWDHDFLKNAEAVLTAIAEKLKTPSPQPSPFQGEGEREKEPDLI